MRKVMTTIVAAMLMGTSAQAQMQPKVLGKEDRSQPIRFFRSWQGYQKRYPV